MTQYKKMQDEMASALEDLIWQHHFKAARNENGGWLPQVERGCDSYIVIAIRECPEFNKEDNTLTYNIRANGSVCQMNPNSDTEELLHAAEEIKRGAELINAINEFGLTYTMLLDKSIVGAVFPNDGKALRELLDHEPGTFRHLADFEFRAQTKDGRQMHIATEPADPEDEEYTSIRIIGITVF